MTTEDEGHWCQRCKANVPLDEWRYDVRHFWSHQGPLRGIVYKDPDDPGECGWATHIPRKVA